MVSFKGGRSRGWGLLLPQGRWQDRSRSASGHVEILVVLDAEQDHVASVLGLHHADGTFEIDAVIQQDFQVIAAVWHLKVG